MYNWSVPFYSPKFNAITILQAQLYNLTPTCSAHRCGAKKNCTSERRLFKFCYSCATNQPTNQSVVHYDTLTTCSQSNCVRPLRLHINAYYAFVKNIHGPLHGEVMATLENPCVGEGRETKKRTGCDPWRLGVSRTSSHFRGLNTTPF